MQYSPKLKKAMEEIKAVLNKHDIAASVILHTHQDLPNILTTLILLIPV
jgi:hypothetical protein